jgi:signal transduction histidine kinase
MTGGTAILPATDEGRSGPRPAWRQLRVQSWLRWMVLGCLLPSVALAVFMIMQSYDRRRAELERDTIATTRALMQAIDRDLANVEATLKGLARSPYLARGDLAAFHQQATALLPGIRVGAVILSEPTGRQLVNTERPFGAALPRHGNPGQLREVIGSGRAMLSELQTDGISGQPAIAIEVPVLLDGRPAYGLAGLLFPDRLVELLRRQRLPPGWVATLADSGGMMIARSGTMSGYVGRRLQPPVLQRLAEAPEGVLTGSSRDNVAVFASFSRSPQTGWSVFIGIPTTTLASDLQISLWQGIAVASMLVLFGLVCAGSVGAHIGRSIEALQAPALALASDRHPVVPAYGVAEVGEVGAALVRASRLMLQREHERAQAEAGLRDAVRRLEERRMELERSNADLDDFAYSAAHDLRSPLRVLGQLVTRIDLELAAVASRETASNLALLKGRVARLLALLDGLVAYAQAGRRQFSVEVVDTRALVHDVVAALAPAPGFIVACNGEMPTIRTPRAPLELVLRNLIGNALRHHDRAQGTIALAARLTAGVVEFRVQDDGPGILPRFHGRIFGIFQTLRSRDELDTSGIGLAIVKRKVEGRGGTIRVESAPPARGASFVFTWPEATV